MIKHALTILVVSAGLMLATAAASPINFNYGYNLTATTQNGISVTGTFVYNPATQTFAPNQWQFNFSNNGSHDSDLNNGVLFLNPDTHIGGELAYTDAAVSLSELGFSSGPNTYNNGGFFEFDQSSGTGTQGWGSSSVQSSLVLLIDSLPYLYTDPAGNLLSGSEFDQAPNLQLTQPNFSDFLSGTVTLEANQELPAPVTTPEPATWALLGTGALLLAGLALSEERRRRAEA
ncbi:MAG TPA: PEP-CTERM sorting domain-containing protein [Terriglobales bacterium]|nr:PEP-CTERM sorting domain-containing protein [Terriglobales bacterium]